MDEYLSLDILDTPAPADDAYVSLELLDAVAREEQFVPLDLLDRVTAEENYISLALLDMPAAVKHGKCPHLSFALDCHAGGFGHAGCFSHDYHSRCGFRLRFEERHKNKF